MNTINHFVDHLSLELQQLYELFEHRWSNYGADWKDLPFYDIIQKLIGDNPSHKGGVKKLLDAVDEGNWEHIRQEALNSILVLFFVLDRANIKLGEKNGHNKERNLSGPRT